MSSDRALEADLVRLLGRDAVVAGDGRAYRADATEGRGLSGRPAAVVLPGSTEEVERLVAWCYAHDTPIVPRGGGTGFAGGAVPIDGGVVVGSERMNKVRAFDPPLWRMHAEAGVTTGTVRRLARENGLMYPPDPGASETSLIGGNIATNAGGPHTFAHGVTGPWVTGLEAVVPPGETIVLGGPLTKDVAGYDLKSLLIGSEGTLGIITAAWLRLRPARELSLPLVAFYPDAATGCAALARVLGAGLEPAALEYLDAGALAAARASLPLSVPDGARFALISEAEGTRDGAPALHTELTEQLRPDSLAVLAPDSPSDTRALWRWRDGVSGAVAAVHGGKVSEDIVVPVDRLAEAIEETVAIGRRHELETCSWGHAGDGNLHATFLVAREDRAGLARAEAACEELFAFAARAGGSVSGEHGLGWTKRGQLARQWPERALALHEAIKHAFDPKGLMNPGKKTARPSEGLDPALDAVDEKENGQEEQRPDH